MAIFPFILIKNSWDRDNKRLINHEKIHLRQQLELLIVFFYVWYAIEYCYGLIKYRNSYSAYRHISFEREAYENENDLDYLANRKLFSFWNYIKN